MTEAALFVGLLCATVGWINYRLGYQLGKAAGWDEGWRAGRKAVLGKQAPKV